MNPAHKHEDDDRLIHEYRAEEADRMFREMDARNMATLWMLEEADRANRMAVKVLCFAAIVTAVAAGTMIAKVVGF